MRHALHPSKAREVSAEDYQREFGNQPVGHKGVWRPPPARCRFCPSGLFLRAKASPMRAAHFSHPSDAVCPSMARTGRPYHRLTPAKPAPEAARTLFDAFAADWRSHLAAVGQLVVNLTINEFLELVQAATELSSWAYEGMPVWAIPYMLVLQRDFPPQRPRGRPDDRHLRRLYFRFWFHHEPLGLDALWINQEGRTYLVRATYELPLTRRTPTEEDLTAEPRRFQVGPELLAGAGAAVRPLPQNLVDRVEAGLARLRPRLQR